MSDGILNYGCNGRHLLLEKRTRGQETRGGMANEMTRQCGVTKKPRTNRSNHAERLDGKGLAVRSHNM